MKLCAISFKPCWQDEDGHWVSDGGFPLQMTWISTLFDEMTLVITAGTRGGGGLPLPRHANVVALRLPEGMNLRRKIAVIWNIFYYIRAIAPHVRRADVVHVPLPGDLPFIGMLLAIVFRKRVIARYGSSWAPTAQSTVMTNLTKALMRWFAGGRNVMLATGDARTPPAPQVSWIFSTAITNAELKAIPRAVDRGLQDPPRIAYIGRLAEEKGLRILLDAVHQLKEHGLTPIPRVTLIGSGPEGPLLEKYAASLGLAEVVRFTGQLNREALSEMLKQCDFCVQPSLTEGFSKAWLDAFAHGLPVLASEVGAANPVIGGNGERGWLVPPGDARKLEEQLHRIMTDSLDWPALRQRCREFTERRTLEVWAEEIGKICARQWGIRFEGGKLRA